MKRPYFLTIQKKFLILVLLVGLAPAAAGVIVTVGGSRLSFAWATANGLELRVREAADRIGQACEERHERLGAIVRETGGELLRIRLDPATVASADLLVRYRRGEELYVVPIDPREPELAERLREHPELFAAYLEANAIGPAGIFDDLQLGKPAGGGDAFVLSIFPEPGGGLLFFVARAERVLRDIPTTLVQDTFLAVYSRKGFMVTPSPTDLDLLKESRERFGPQAGAAPAWFNLSWREGNRRQWRLVAHAPVPRLSRLGAGTTARASPWIVLLTYDMESFLGPQSTLIWTTVFVAVIWGLLLMAVSVFVTRRVVGPVKALRYQAEAMAAGDLDAQARVRTRDEIQDLAEAFNTMARKAAQELPRSGESGRREPPAREPHLCHQRNHQGDYARA
jgi:HAMP domain-containing protein